MVQQLDDSKSLIPKAAKSVAAAGTRVTVGSTAKAGSPTATGTSATAEEQQKEGCKQQQEPCRATVGTCPNLLAELFPNTSLQTSKDCCILDSKPQKMGDIDWHGN